jgi:hypothetical protein
MLAVIAGIVFIIAAVVALIEKSVSTPHLFVFLFIGMAFVCGHLAFRVWTPAGRW